MRRCLKTHVALVYAAGLNQNVANSFLFASRRTAGDQRGNLSLLAGSGSQQNDGVGGTTRSFKSLGLRPELLDAVTRLGYEALTDIQEGALPPALAGSDVVGKARTGSGKTAVFALALLQKLDLTLDNRGGRPQALVLSPTRELAAQLVGSIRGLAAAMGGVRVLAATGGTPSRDQRSGLERGMHVVVATPGRCLQLLEGGYLDPQAVSCLVMDEADTLLDMGFEEEVHRIVEFLPSKGRQTLLFSATWGERVDKLSKRVQRLPKTVSDGEAGGGTAARSLLKQSALLFEGGAQTRLEALAHVLSNADAADSNCVVFCETRDQCKSVASFLVSRGASASALHGGLEQKDREKTLLRFRNKSCRVLVATNVASRGLDIQGVSLVVCFELNDDPHVHVHRVGRTARADSAGEAVSLVSVGGDGDDLSRLDTIDSALKGEPITRYTWNLQNRQEIANIKLDGWVADWRTVLILGGRKDKLRPGDVLGAISSDTVGIEGQQVGKIDVTEKRTWVAVHHSVATKAVEGLGNVKIKKRRFKVHLI